MARLVEELEKQDRTCLPASALVFRTNLLVLCHASVALVPTVDAKSCAVEDEERLLDACPFDAAAAAAAAGVDE